MHRRKCKRHLFALLLAAPLIATQAQPDDLHGPERDRWQMPKEVLAALGLKKGDTVADIGAGIGYFTMHFARAVGPKGRVFAVDVDGHVLEYLRKEAEKQRLNNVQTLTSREDDPLLPTGSVSVAFLCNTVHEIAGRVSFYRKVKLALKRHGRLAVIDFAPPAGKSGDASHESEGNVTRDLTVREAEEAGFRLVKELKFLPRQYFLVFARRDA